MFYPVDPDEMAFALTLFVSAATGQISSGGKPMTIQNRQTGQGLFLSLVSLGHLSPGGDPVQAVLDTPLFRAFLLVWEHYKNDLAQFSLGARILGFYHVTTRTKGAALQRWIVPNPDASQISDELVDLHPAVVEALAIVPLTSEGRLDEASFLSTIGALGPDVANAALDQAMLWPRGSGTMATLVRQFDWSKTALGKSEDWPQSLRSVVDMALACRFPMVILWRAELTQIYNDAYCDLMGSKHPRGLGQPTRECWPEVWHINEPIFQRVFLGETLTFEDGLYPIHRHGHLEDAYFTLCYSPLRDESSVVQGALVTVFETTERVRAEMKPQESVQDKGHERPSASMDSQEFLNPLPPHVARGANSKN